MQTRGSYRAAWLLAVLAAAARAAEQRFYIPNMSMFRELSPVELDSQIHEAKAQWPTRGKGSNCTAAASPCPADLLTTWWAEAPPAQRAYVLMGLSKDSYPKPESLGVAQDGAAYQCKLRAKWKALGASNVKFINTPLTNMVLIKAGSTVFINYRGTWTGLHESNNADEWTKTPGPLAGQVHRGWLRSVRESWPEAERVITKDLRCGGKCSLVFSGHNRGGALAMIAAASVPAVGAGKVEGVYTFGSPRPGGQEFQDAYDLTLGDVTFSYWNRLDWVPRQPYVNAPMPSLRLTENFCPTAKSGDACYELSANDARGRARAVRRCSKVTSDAEGDTYHLERAYLSSLKTCAGTMRLEESCVAAL